MSDEPVDLENETQITEEAVQSTEPNPEVADDNSALEDAVDAPEVLTSEPDPTPEQVADEEKSEEE